MRAVIYTRVSDPSQVENNSLDSQKEICTKFAKTHGYTVIEEFREEGVSAKHIHTRPTLRELMAFVTKKSNNISAVIVYKYDRFSRNLEEGLATIGLLAKHQVVVLSATENTDESPMGRAMRNIMMTLGQLDNEMKGERVKDNMQGVFRAGLWPFKSPIGYKRRFRTKEENKGIPPIPDPYLGPIITKMITNASTGIYSKSQLAKMMNLEGFAEYYGVKADHKIVKKILEKSFYYGRMYAKKWDEYAPGKHVPLIDEETWKRAYHYLILKKKNYHPQDTELYPLKGFLKCEYCNHPMTTSPSKGTSGIVHYYECKNKSCSRLRINAKSAHKQFEDLLTSIQPTSRVIKLFQFLVFEDWDKSIDQAKKEIDAIDRRIQEFKDELKSIRKAKDDGLYTAEQAKEEADKAQQEITILSVERSEMRIEQYNEEIVREFTDTFLKNLALLWNHMDLPKQQALTQKIFLGTVICTADRKIRTNELSPSFKLIQSLKDENDQIVTPPRFELGLPG